MLALRKNSSRYLDLFVYAAFAGLFFDIQVSNITLILLLAASLLSLDFSTLKKTLSSSAPVQALIVFYLIHVVAMSYSENVSNGMFVLEKKISLLLLPVITFPAVSALDEKQKKNLTLWLGTIAIASSLIFIIIAATKVALYNFTLAFHRDYFASIPYVFYSIYFATGSLLLLEWLNQHLGSRYGAVIKLALIAYSLGILVVIGSKTGILAYTGGVVYFLYRRVPSRKVFFLSLAIVAVLMVILLKAYPSTLERFTELGKNLHVVSEEKIVRPEEFTGLNLRLFFWRISLQQLWHDQAWIVGVGTGDAQDYLNRIFEAHNLDDYGYSNFDAHSQWVTTLLQTGAIGLLIVISCFVFSWRDAIRKMNLSLWFLTWIVFCFCFSESVFESNKGIVFFALLLSILCALDSGPRSHQTGNTLPENPGTS